MKNLSINSNGDTDNTETVKYTRLLIQNIMQYIESLALEIRNEPTILISIKHQKTLRTCFQILTTFGMAPCMIPGIGITLAKRITTSQYLPSVKLSDEEKYELLVDCTEFLTRCYSTPVLRKIIVTLHLTDYLAALIQLCFAPLKKPGTYQNFIMTQEMYSKLTNDKAKYTKVYEELIENSFQPILMKELLVLQSVTDPTPPTFVKKLITKEMSRRLLCEQGLLSLIRCFIETYSVDTGYEWKKIDMICKIVSARHGSGSEDEYLNNMTAQITKILLLSNTQYLATAVACTLRLYERFPQFPGIQTILTKIFRTLDKEFLLSKGVLCGTIVLSAQEIEHTVNILSACMCSTVNMNLPVELLLPNILLLMQLGMKCTKNQEMKIKIREVLLTCLAACSKQELLAKTTSFLFGTKSEGPCLTVEEYESGVVIKCTDSIEAYPSNDAVLYYLEIFKAITHKVVVATVFEVFLQLLLELTVIREKRGNNDLLALEQEPEIMQEVDHKYAMTLQMLTEISTQPKVTSALKDNPVPVLDFIEYFLQENKDHKNEECITISLVLLTTILSGAYKSNNLGGRYRNLMPVLQSFASDNSSLNNILSKEALALMSSGQPAKIESHCDNAVAKVFDKLLPVRAQGVIELTKLINAKDPETISKKHYIFCLFQVKPL